MKKIYWFCGPEEYRLSGIGNFSNTYIQELKKHYNIIDIWFKGNPKSFLRVIKQFILIPIKLIFDRVNTKIFYDEGWLPIIFFPINKMNFIIHDVRDFNHTSKDLSIVQKLYFYFIKKAFLKLNTKKVLKIITVSEFTKSKLLELGVKEEKINVIYSPIDTNIFKKDVSVSKESLFIKYGIDTKYISKKIILNVGSEESRKNIITILKLMKSLDDYIFVKIGKPIITENRDMHLEYLKENNITNVFFINTDLKDLISFYSISDIFLFPSLFEGFGRPPIEAQACGLPVISSDKGGLKEVLNGTSIILGNPSNESEILQKIKDLENNFDLHVNIINMGIENCQRFTVENNIGKWKKIFGDI